MEDVREEWVQARHRVTDSITVSGPTVVHVRRSSYPIRRVTVTWEWGDPNADDAPGDPFVILYTASRQHPDREDGGRLFLDQLKEVPEWLDSIILRSMPRL